MNATEIVAAGGFCGNARDLRPREQGRFFV